MSVVTKTGDLGKTSLLDGSRISKSSAALEAYGSIDELNSFLGLCRTLSLKEPKLQVLEVSLKRIQNECFVLGAHLSLPQEASMHLAAGSLPSLNLLDIELLENEIEVLEKQIPRLTQFILPGGHPIACHLHIARTVTRRAERAIVHLYGTLDASAESEMKKKIVSYVNRLSDWCFIAARWTNMKVNSAEEFWDLK